MPRTHFSPWLRYAFGLTLFFSALSGFAQMPIFKRYYIADIPGLGWLAQFYTTFYLHYISAIALLAILAYMVAIYWLAHRRTLHVSLWGYLRGSVLLIILITGVLLVFRNMPGYRFSPQFVAILDFTHLGMVMLLLLVQIVTLIGRRTWLVSR